MTPGANGASQSVPAIPSAMIASPDPTNCRASRPVCSAPHLPNRRIVGKAMLVLLPALDVRHQRDRADVAVGHLELRAEELHGHALRPILRRGGRR